MYVSVYPWSIVIENIWEVIPDTPIRLGRLPDTGAEVQETSKPAATIVSSQSPSQPELGITMLLLLLKACRTSVNKEENNEVLGPCPVMNPVPYAENGPGDIGTVRILTAGVGSMAVLDARCSNGPSIIAILVRIAAKAIMLKLLPDDSAAQRL